MIVTLGSHQDITRFLRVIRTLSGISRTIICPSGLISMTINAHSPSKAQKTFWYINETEVLFFPLLSVLFCFVLFSPKKVRQVNKTDVFYEKLLHNVKQKASL